MSAPQTEPRRPAEASRLRPIHGFTALLGLAGVLAVTHWLWQNDRAPWPHEPSVKGSTFMPNVNKSDAEWRAQLTPEQYEVTRNKGTERAFTGAFWNHKEQGKYKCVGCGAELFTSDTKYDSQCGWPSFFDADHPDNLHTEEDRAYGMLRTEVTCKNCGAHLGHIFDDGPQPTGTRYCINSASLAFEKKDAEQSADESK